MISQKPFFLILTSNDGELSVEEEGRNIIQALQPVKASEIIGIEYLPQVDIQTLEQTFQVYEQHNKHINFIHYAGHADGKKLMLDDAEAHRKGLAHLFKGANIIFLNGCATLGHIHELHNHGVEAIIATDAPVNDEKAKQFARTFYQSISAGKSLDASFKKAVHAILTRYDDKYFEESKKGLKLRRKSKKQATTWELHYLNETILDWTIHQPITGQQHLSQIEGLKNYLQKVQNQFNQVRIFGMSKPVPLKDLYVNANILKRRTESQRISVEEFETYFEKDRKGFGQVLETRPAEQIALENQYLLILGKPGAGKTTFLKSLALKSATNSNRRIPIFVNLKTFGDEKVTLLNHLSKIFKLQSYTNADRFILDHLYKGLFQILLDGLDEVTESEKNRVIQNIIEFTEEYDKNQFIITCRIAAYNHWFNAFTEVEVADFNDTQVEKFIQNWFKEENDIGEDCWKQIKTDNRLLELSRVPLLLTLLCINFEENYDFPTNRAELYEAAIEALLKKWDSTRRIRRPKIYQSLSIKRKETMFAQIAYKTFTNDQYFLPKRVLENYIAKFIKELPEVKEADLIPESENVLQSIVAQHNIFTPRARGIYSFSHLTFQEYFCARYIVGSEKAQHELVEKYLADPKWKEVFLLVAGMFSNMESADRFITLINQYVKLKSNFKLVENINEIVNLSSSYNLISQRVFLLFLIVNNEYRKYLNNNKKLNYLTLAHFKTLRVTINLLIRITSKFQAYSMITDLAFSLDRKINRYTGNLFQLNSSKTIFQSDLDSANQLSGILKEEINDFSCTLQDVFGFKIDLKQLDYHLEFELIAYFAQNILLLQCLQSDIYMSKKLKQETLNNLFTVS